MAIRKSTGPTNRSLLNHGPGKGDKSRVEDAVAYEENLSQVHFSGVPASQDPSFEKRGTKSVKVYGQRAVVPDVKLTSKPIIH